MVTVFLGLNNKMVTRLVPWQNNKKKNMEAKVMG